MKLLCVYFVTMLVTWTSFTFIARELKRCILTMLETHIVMSSLIFCLVPTLVLHLTLLLMLCLVSLMDLTITHMILIHERTTLSLDALVTTHVELRHMDGPRFPHHGSHPTGTNGEVLKTVKTYSGRLVKCWIFKIYLTSPSTEPSTSSCPT
jgi:hypothetical protein